MQCSQIPLELALTRLESAFHFAVSELLPLARSWYGNFKVVYVSKHEYAPKNLKQMQEHVQRGALPICTAGDCIQGTAANTVFRLAHDLSHVISGNSTTYHGEQRTHEFLWRVIKRSTSYRHAGAELREAMRLAYVIDTYGQTEYWQMHGAFVPCQVAFMRGWYEGRRYAYGECFKIKAILEDATVCEI